jgi:hypothetical protein
VEEEDAEGAVEEAVVDVGHEVAGFFGGRAERVVVGVEDDADFVHEADLFSIVAGEVVVLVGRAGKGGGGGGGGGGEVCVYFREEVEDVLGGYGLSAGGRHCGREMDLEGKDGKTLDFELLNGWLGQDKS